MDTVGLQQACWTAMPTNDGQRRSKGMHFSSCEFTGVRPTLEAVGFEVCSFQGCQVAICAPGLWQGRAQAVGAQVKGLQLLQGAVGIWQSTCMEPLQSAAAIAAIAGVPVMSRP